MLGAMSLVDGLRAIVGPAHVLEGPASVEVRALRGAVRGPRLRTAPGPVDEASSPWVVVIALGVLVTMVGILPWYYQLRWRFSLRTLLIATTLVAVVLGLIVCLR